MNKVFNTPVGTIIRTNDRVVVEGEFAWLNEYLPEGEGSLITFDLMAKVEGVFEATVAEEDYVVRAKAFLESQGTRVAKLFGNALAAGCELNGLMVAGALVGMATANSPELLAEMQAACEALGAWVTPEDQALCEALNARVGGVVAEQLNAIAADGTIH